MKQDKVAAKSDGSSISIDGLVIVCFLSAVGSVILGTLNAADIGGLFNNTIIVLSNKYYTEVQPAPAVFGIIWPIIYVWILAANIYMVVSLSLPENESPVKNKPTLTPPSFLISFSIASLSTVLWLFAFDRENLALSAVALFIGAVTLWFSALTSLVLVYDNEAQLEKNSEKMLWTVRVLIQNGLCLYGTWLILATSIGFCTLLLYIGSPGSDTAQLRGIVNVEDGSSITLLVLFVIAVVLFIIENFVFEKYFRYVFTVFPVFVLASGGLVARLAELGADRNLILASILLAICVVFLVTRIVLSVLKFTEPKPYSKYHTKKQLLESYD